MMPPGGRRGGGRAEGGLVLGFCLWLAATASAGAAAGRDEGPQRIVSLAPSITETLFALGAGDRVVGVTRQCNYPAAARGKARVGGYYEPHLEAILRLRPDLVLLPPEIYETGQQLARLKVPVCVVGQRTMAGVISSFALLGSLCRQEAAGSRLAAQFLAALQAPEPAAGQPPARVLLVLNRDYGAGQLREIYAAGRGELYDELLNLAGAVNAYPRAYPKYPQLSPEGVLALDPEVIVEFVHPDAYAGPASKLTKDWQQLPGLRSRIVVLAGEHLTIPGPRILQVLDALKAGLKRGREAKQP